MLLQHFHSSAGLSKWPNSIQFCILSLGVFTCYLVCGYLQELMFLLPGVKPHGWYLTLLQFGICAALSFAEMKWFTSDGKIVRRIPWHIYLQISFLTVATIGLSTVALQYLNYPTQLIFKCCKLIPVLIGGVLIQHKRYGVLDLLAAALMSAGLCVFTLADARVSPAFDARGYACISLALAADACIGNVQEQAMRRYRAPNREVVLYSYSIGFIYIFMGTLLSGELSSAFSDFSKNPLQTYGYTVVYGTFAYFGLNVVLTLVRTYGALIAVTVTTMRKAVTIVLSFYFFAKPFSMGYVWGGLIVVGAIYVNVYSKNRHNIDAKMAKLWRIRPCNEKKKLEEYAERKLMTQV